MFNDGHYWERAERGEFVKVQTADHHCDPVPLPGELPCLRSQGWSLYDANKNEIARVHYYLRPNGTIAASGLPDPKRLLENGVLYRMQKQPRVATSDNG